MPNSHLPTSTESLTFTNLLKLHLSWCPHPTASLQLREFPPISLCPDLSLKQSFWWATGARCLPERIFSYSLGPISNKILTACFIVSGCLCHRDLSSSFPFPVGLMYKSQADRMQPLHLKLPFPKEEGRKLREIGVCVHQSVEILNFCFTCMWGARFRRKSWDENSFHSFMKNSDHTISKIIDWKCFLC